MNRQKALLLGSLIVLVACQTEEQEADSVAVLPFSSVEESAAIEEYLRKYELAPGNWRQEGNARTCDGYMTRFEDVDYCAATIPDDWEPFEFNGTIYYVQPLAGAGVQPGE